MSSPTLVVLTSIGAGYRVLFKSSASVYVRENLITKPIITSARNATSALNLRRGFVNTGGLRIVCIGVKDVIFGEDAAPLSNYNAATNWSFIRTIAVNVARMCGYNSLTKAERFLAHDIDKLFSLVE
jgi:hypothetical protein